MSLGQPEECPGDRCAFWEAGGAVVSGGCGLERLAVDFGDRELVRHLLDLRHALERSRSEEETAAALEELGKLVPPDLVDIES